MGTSDIWRNPNRRISQEYEMDLWDSTGAKEAEPRVILGKVLNRLGEFGVRYPSIYEGIGSVCLQLIQLWDGCVS